MRSLVAADSVVPNWIDDRGDRFWYRVKTGHDEHEFVLVNAGRANRGPALDHQRLCDLLSAATGDRLHPTRLQLQSLAFSTDGQVAGSNMGVSDGRSSFRAARFPRARMRLQALRRRVSTPNDESFAAGMAVRQQRYDLRTGSTKLCNYSG